MYPIKQPCYITQGFGKTAFAMSPTGQAFYKNFGGIHPGIDFASKAERAELITLFDGEVIFAKEDGGWGGHILIKTADGWDRQYAHCREILCTVGQKVKRGDVIGIMGGGKADPMHGSSTGRHLHYSKRRLANNKKEYADPSSDFIDSGKVENPQVQDTPKMPTKRLVKAVGIPDLYAWTGKSLWHIPDMETLNFLFPNETWEELPVEALAKLPRGKMSSLK